MAKQIKFIGTPFLAILMMIVISSCRETIMVNTPDDAETVAVPLKKTIFPKRIIIPETVRIRDYFDYVDSLAVAYDSVNAYPISEHILVRANPWIIDTLANTDYYRMIQRDSFVYDQKEMVVLKPADTLIIPDSLFAYRILGDMGKTWIDVNIPEFKLRIYQDSTLLFTFPIRVGQNRERYLAMSDRVTDLRTIKGNGQIIRHVKNPDFYNPVNCKQFYVTKRDDERTTLMPQIPWIETEINGIRNGQMIHPTTNPKTLGKAYSNGCIGVKEADAWVIYYYAPVGTRIQIRYDLRITNESGKELIMKDIYQRGD